WKSSCGGWTWTWPARNGCGKTSGPRNCPFRCSRGSRRPAVRIRRILRQSSRPLTGISLKPSRSSWT
ncbi:hypothetical protein, partial [Arthrobacter sp. DR-2P]